MRTRGNRRTRYLRARAKLGTLAAVEARMTLARARKLGWITLSLLAFLALFATASLFGIGALVVGY